MRGAWVFDLDGGRPCLDFANTLSATSGDHLSTYADLVAFAEQSGLVTQADAEWLRTEGVREPASAEAVLARAHHLRAAIYGVFSGIAAGTAPLPRDVDVLNAELAAALQHACVELTPNQHAYRWGWAGHEIDSPLWGICRSAADLLVSDEDSRRVRECNGDECNWLFVDTSKNHSRQWCSMQSCGNRHKARRHYQRRRAQQPSLVKD
jgi:predicted RNA-binding Zn ribbon-like protein